MSEAEGSGAAGGAGRGVVAFLDYTCPFSYLLERSVLAPLREEAGAAVAYRAFELWPEPAPLPDAGDPGERRKWEEQAIPLARELGIALRRPGLLPRTRKAHEAAVHAREHGGFEAFHAAVYRAYFAEGRDIGRIDVLVEVGTAAGLDTTALKVALDIDQHTERVLREEATARAAGVSAAPTLLVDGEVVIGFHDRDTVRALIARDG